MSRIIHIGRNGSIMNNFVKFMENNFESRNHFFYLTGKETNDISNVVDITNKKDFIKKILQINIELYKSKKIIIHGFNQTYLFYLFFFQPWLLKKCYWVMWGGDLYSYQQEATTFKYKVLYFMRDNIYKKMGHLVTGTIGDYKLAQKWYGTTGKHIKCFNYPSNLYKEYDISPKEHTTINIQLGNSADPTNNHIEVLEKLKAYKDKDIKIFTPLSYGNQEYAQSVISKGKELFGEKFVALTDFMAFDKYLEFLGTIDIAIFAHKRQQAFGNTITLLGMGKKVYLDQESTLNSVFKEKKIKIFNLDEINLSYLDEDTQRVNIQQVKANFSRESLVNSLNFWIN